MRFWGTIIGSIVVAVGTFGIITGYLSHGCWKCLYSACLIVLLVISISLLIAMIVVRGRLNSNLYSVSTCMDVPSLKEADDEVKKASALMCSATCPCNNFFDTEKIQGSATNILTCRLWESTDPDTMAYVATLGGPTYCARHSLGIPEDFTEHYFKDKYWFYADLMTWAEENLDWAGVCSPEKYYTFSDVNRGLPETDCRTRFRGWADDLLLLIAGILIIITVWMLIIFVISSCVCFHMGNRKVFNKDLESPLSPKND